LNHFFQDKTRSQKTPACESRGNNQLIQKNDMDREKLFLSPAE